MEEAREHMLEVVDDVETNDRVYALTADGGPRTILMSIERYESLIETIAVYETFPDIQRDVAEADSAMKTGEYKNWLTLEDLERKWEKAN